MQFNLKHLLALTAFCAVIFGIVFGWQVFRKNNADLNLAIYTTLQQRSDFENNAITLDEWTSKISAHFDFDVRIRFCGVESAQTIKRHTFENLSLKSYVRLILKECDASYRIRNGELVVVPFNTPEDDSDYNGPPIRTDLVHGQRNERRELQNAR